MTRVTRDLPRNIHREVSRHGREVFYFRRGRSGRRVRIHGQPGTSAFEDACCLARDRGISAGRSKPASAVYFFTLGRKVKIGVSTNIEGRRKALQTSSPGKGAMYYATPGERRLERYLHGLFADDRINGEWFHFTRPIREWIEQDEAERKRRRQEAEVAAPPHPLPSRVRP